MPQINLLSKEVSELIAAGEVIERPASIVKELVENSIDAKATAITVEIQNGGVRFIRITDNGCGISSADAPKAFLRHATSKVKEVKDLDSIKTLGFRGEALASIAAVSKIELMTKTKDEELGTYLKMNGSELLEVRESGCPQGTTITVRDIFYNVPARLKFLKKDVTEGNTVASIVEKIALSHPEISVKLIRDNKVIFHTPGDNKLLSAIYTIFGREFAQNMIPLQYEFDSIKIKGFIGQPMFHRANRSMQHFFINGRYTKTRICGIAMEEGYKGSIMVGKFPACVMEIEMPFDRVDVNVHPAKIEVRFSDEKGIFDAIYFAVKSAISEYGSLNEAKSTPEVKKEIKENVNFNILTPFSDKNTFSVQEKIKVDTSLTEKNNLNERIYTYNHTDRKDIRTIFEINSPEMDIKENTDLKPENVSPENIKDTICEDNEDFKFNVIGELFATYILVQVDEEFIIIDKHAAHERILYNKLKDNYKELDKQFLLSPITVSLSRQEYEVTLEKTSLLSTFGFVVDDFGGLTVILRSIPATTEIHKAKEMFLDAVAGLMKNRNVELPEVIEDILHRIACRSAVKSNDKNTSEELEELVKTIYFDEKVRYCPHGRPVMIRYTKKEIEKLFGRIV